ncbi:MAG TPA: DUF4177 domain-containing protein [Anaerolineae bacterium]|jgi:hypothetical protein|nr:DUF4177 domain-containing protein [Anaerolineae bacterium]
MYEYRFERIDMKFMSSTPQRDYHEIIERYAREGWRFVQIFAPASVMSGGAAGYMEIIFEREAEKA